VIFALSFTTGIIIPHQLVVAGRLTHNKKDTPI
jgi:hypothetical protein